MAGITGLENIKLIVSDMDGTLLNSEGKVSDSFFSLFDKLQSRGVQFVAASGRQYYSIIDKLEPIWEHIGVIAENGGIARRMNEELVLVTLEPKLVRELIRTIRKIPDCDMVLCAKKQAYVESTSQDFLNFFSEYYVRYQRVKDLTQVTNDDFFKIAIYNAKGTEENVYPRVKHLEGDLQVKVSGEYWLDLSHLDANKGHALGIVQDKLNITPQETLVLGDYNNDLEMMRQSNFSFAMENAHPNVKKAASYRTKSNDEYGVEHVMEQVLEAIEN